MNWNTATQDQQFNKIKAAIDLGRCVAVSPDWLIALMLERDKYKSVFDDARKVIELDTRPFLVPSSAIPPEAARS